jgi:hypothetical protein
MSETSTRLHDTTSQKIVAFTSAANCEVSCTDTEYGFSYNVYNFNFIYFSYGVCLMKHTPYEKYMEYV